MTYVCISHILLYATDGNSGCRQGHEEKKMCTEVILWGPTIFYHPTLTLSENCKESTF